MVAAVLALALVALVAAIAIVDFRHQIIPDELNLALAVVGLGGQAAMGGAPLAALLWGLGVGLGMWGFAAGFRRFRGMTGLGLGDVKMAGASATWVDPWNLPILFFTACIAALSFAIFAALAQGRLDRTRRIPFGPFIGLGLMITWALEQTNLPTLSPSFG